MRLMTKCCKAYDPKHGCPHEICPGCFLTKLHDDYHCRPGLGDGGGGCTCVYPDCKPCQEKEDD